MMTKKQSTITKGIVFILGLGIIALAFALFTKGSKIFPRQIYLWVSIAVMYIVFLSPFFFSLIPVKNAKGKISSLKMVWLGAIVFIAISIAMTTVVVLSVVQIPIAIVTELVLLFLFAIDAYICYFSMLRTHTVIQSQAEIPDQIKRIQTSMAMLSLKASSLTDVYTDEKKKILFLVEETNTLLPADDLAASSKVEQVILGSITAVSSACDATLAGSTGSELSKQRSSLETLIKQRKAMS